MGRHDCQNAAQGNTDHIDKGQGHEFVPGLISGRQVYHVARGVAASETGVRPSVPEQLSFHGHSALRSMKRLDTGMPEAVSGRAAKESQGVSLSGGLA